MSANKSGQSVKRKAKDKAFYIKSAKQGKWSVNELCPGVRGFLCTSNNRERESTKEAYNILNEFADVLYGTEESTKSNDVEDAKQEIEDELSKEVADLKSQSSAKEKRFQSVITGVKSCIFVKTTVFIAVIYIYRCLTFFFNVLILVSWKTPWKS